MVRVGARLCPASLQTLTFDDAGLHKARFVGGVRAEYQGRFSGRVDPEAVTVNQD